MNPQYAAQQAFGAPPQPFPPNASSPSLGQPHNQGFQNIPLGPQKPPVGQPNGPPQLQQQQLNGPPPHQPPPGSFVPTSTPLNSGAPLSSNPNLRSQVPLNQLPPSQDQRPPSGPPPSNQFGPTGPNKIGGSNDFKPPGVQNGSLPFQNGPPQFQNGPPQFQNGPGFGPPQPSSVPTGQLPPGPPKPLSSNVPSVPNQFGPPGQNPRPTQPPLLGQNPNQASFPGQPPNSQAAPPGQPPLSNPNVLTSPAANSPPLNNQQPGLPNQAPKQRPLLSGQPHVAGPQPLTQPQLGGQSPLNQPPLLHSSAQQVPPLPNQPYNNALPPQPQFGAPGRLPPGPPGQFNQPPLPGQQPPGQFNQPPLPGQQPPGQFNQPPLPGQQPPGQFNQPPLSGQQPPGQFNQPPLPGQQPPGQFNQPPLPGQQPPGQFNQPPLLGQQPGPNQLANQMQGMNIGGARQYPGGPMRNQMNGEGGPHMPPPITQQQYLNGQQMRNPPQGGPGYPPMPGQQQQMPAAPGQYPGYHPQQPAKRLDPDQMPSPIQVTQDDQQNRSGVFATNQKGLVPPLVTTNFVTHDQGNASPRFIRSTMYSVPVSTDILKQSALPFSLVISPMAKTIDQEYPPPIVNFGNLGPVRCIRCKAYMCPFMQFIDSGRRFQCLFCKATTDVPQEYFQHLDHTGQRLDRFERPELILGTYEFVATTDYCRNNTLPKPPAIIFVIDVSYNNIKSGLVHLLCAQMKEIIQNLPVDQGEEKSNVKVGFITYNSSVHFYNIKGNLAAPQMLIVGDTQEMFMPLLDGFLCTPEESGPVIDSLMEQIPEMFGDTRETETILLPAIVAGLEALKASDTTGKLMVFHSSLPTAEAPGKLKNRDDRKLLATDKEKTILTPQTQAYNQLGQDCVQAGCSVDLFLFNNAYIDVATIGQVARLTGGEVYKYTYFQADIDGERLIQDIIIDISRPIAFDSIMRVRTSTGVRPTDFYGHFFMSNTTDMELAAIDCDKAVAVEIKHDDKLSEEEGVYIQAALLYTSCSGQRRLRIINLSLKTCSQMADLYRSCDCDTIINYLAKQSTYKLLEHNPKAVKDNLVTRGAQILATYRKNCASPSSAGQLILPECMKLLPLYVNCLLKSDAISGGPDMTIDDRSYAMQEVMIMDIPTSVNYFYPRLIPLIELDPTQDPVEVPASIRCTADKINEQGVYILENGIHMFLWFGLGVNPDFMQKVFGVQSAIQADIERISLPELDNPLSLAVRNVIEQIRLQRHRYMRLTIVRQREKLEPVFKHFLAEDRGTDGSASYVDFLVHMHKEIRNLLS